MAPGQRSPLSKPIVSRCISLALAGCLGSSTASAAADPRALTETEALERALTNPSLAELRAGWVGAAKADGLDRAAWQNPSLSYTREQLIGSTVLGEDYLTLSQQFDLSGRRSLARQAAAQREGAAGHSADAVLLEFKAEVRRRFYRLLHAQRRQASLSAWHGRVGQRLEAVVAREAAGDAAAYDRVRLEQELTAIEARMAKEGAGKAKAWALLRALVDGASPEERGGWSRAEPRLTGELLPSRSGLAKQDAVDQLTDLPSAKAREAEARALRLDARGSSRWWVPNPSVGAGYKGVDLGGGARANGFVFTLSIPLPAFDRRRGDRTRAVAQSQSLGAQTNLAAAEARGQAAGLWEELNHLSAAAQTLAQDGGRQSEALLAAVEAGYLGGEIGVMELLDAYRSATSTDLMVLDLAMDARRAEIDLSRLTETAT
ncbi:MAG: TolC family protein [Nannocystales bacterium]